MRPTSGPGISVRLWVLVGALALAVGGLAGCGDDEDDGDTGIANPASVYCVEQGGEVVIVTDADGNETGLCRLPDGTEVDEWEYYRQRDEATEPATSMVEVFFSSESEDCEDVEAVTRTVEGAATVEAALVELLGGPTADERDAGLGSWFSADTAGMLQSVEVDDSVAMVSFDTSLREVISGASSSCGSANLLAQLDATILQFDDIDRAIYSLDGDVDAFYEWLQMVSPDR
jgi:putative hemolysin